MIFIICRVYIYIYIYKVLFEHFVFQKIQREIESKGNLVKSLRKRSDQLVILEGEATASSAEGPKENSGERSAQTEEGPQSVSTPRVGLNINRLERITSSLERRWLNLWLRSLEWQCLVEQLLGSQENQENQQPEKVCRREQPYTYIHDSENSSTTTTYPVVLTAKSSIALMFLMF